jgi:hypothetical protein
VRSTDVLEQLGFHDTRGGDRAAARRWGAASGMVATRSDMRHPLRHFNEHLASGGVGEVEHQFGPSADRILR